MQAREQPTLPATDAASAVKVEAAAGGTEPRAALPVVVNAIASRLEKLGAEAIIVDPVDDRDVVFTWIELEGVDLLHGERPPAPLTIAGELALATLNQLRRFCGHSVIWGSLQRAIAPETVEPVKPKRSRAKKPEKPIEVSVSTKLALELSRVNAFGVVLQHGAGITPDSPGCLAWLVNTAGKAGKTLSSLTAEQVLEELRKLPDGHGTFATWKVLKDRAKLETKRRKASPELSPVEKLRRRLEDLGASRISIWDVDGGLTNVRWDYHSGSQTMNVDTTMALTALSTIRTGATHEMIWKALEGAHATPTRSPKRTPTPAAETNSPAASQIRDMLRELEFEAAVACRPDGRIAVAWTNGSERIAVAQWNDLIRNLSRLKPGASVLDVETELYAAETPSTRSTRTSAPSTPSTRSTARTSPRASSSSRPSAPSTSPRGGRQRAADTIELERKVLKVLEKAFPEPVAVAQLIKKLGGPAFPMMERKIRNTLRGPQRDGSLQFTTVEGKKGFVLFVPEAMRAANTDAPPAAAAGGEGR